MASRSAVGTAVVMASLSWGHCCSVDVQCFLSNE